MPQSRIASVTGSSPVAARSRIASVTGSGATLVMPRSRIGRVSGAGAVAVAVAPLTDLVNVEPGTPLVITAVANAPADSWTWRQVSGPTVTLTPSGASVMLPAPAALTGASIVLGVRATIAGVTSTERTVTITTLPHGEWWYVGAGVWKPRFNAFP